MRRQTSRINRRAFLTGGTGALAAAGFAGEAEAAEWTPSEKANVQLVNDFCAAWPSHDVTRIVSFFSDAGAYRMTETAEPAKGREAVTTRIKSSRWNELNRSLRRPFLTLVAISRQTNG